MAVYKVPQDVEADDKLIGPFSFRQFVYLLIVAGAIGIGYGLFRLFPPLAVIPLPVVIFFGALALPLRKDQPMEIYLAAVVSFYLKPRKRFWVPDGVQSLVEIVAPKVIEVQRAKDLSQTEAEQRLSYLANLVDTQGWAVRGVQGVPEPANAMQNDVFFAAQQTEDVLDENSGVARSFDTMIDDADIRRHESLVTKMQQPTPVTIPAVPDPYATLNPSPSSASRQPITPDPTPVATPEPDPNLAFNPYPNSIHQSVIQPLDDQAKLLSQTPSVAEPTQKPATPPSEQPVSPDIISLANNPDLSIETIAHEANRIHQKEAAQQPDDEVVISLR